MSGFAAGMSGTNWYVVNFVFLLVMLFIGYAVRKSKRGWFVGSVVTPMTVSSEEKWERVNKTRSNDIFIVFVPLLLANTVLFFLKSPGRYGQDVFVLSVAGLIAEEVFTLIYTDILERKWLKEQKEKGAPVSDFVFLSSVPKKTIITGIVILIAVVVFFLLFVKFSGFSV